MSESRLRIAVVDYGVGNLRNVYKALEAAGAPAEIVDTPDGLAGAAGIVLPGVGAFGDAAANLRAAGFEAPLLDAIAAPMLGICVGMQVLFPESEESPAASGLGWIKGKVVRLPEGVMIPQMGWNSLSIQRRSEMLDGISDGDMFYFVHSYYGRPEEDSVIAATTEHGVQVTAAICKDNLFATQFHPEKSGLKGLQILKNFVRASRC